METHRGDWADDEKWIEGSNDEEWIEQKKNWGKNYGIVSKLPSCPCVAEGVPCSTSIPMVVLPNDLICIPSCPCPLNACLGNLIANRLKTPYDSFHSTPELYILSTKLTLPLSGE